MQITHKQARKWIQLRLDGAMPAAEQTRLSAHLQDCAECRKYASELEDVESVLLPLMKKQWNARPIPLSVPMLLQKKTSGVSASLLLTTRTAMIGVVLVAFFFSAWQFVRSGPSASNPVALAVPPMPTPSMFEVPSTSTRISLETCERLPYVVQEHDSLESIAQQFSVSQEQIMEVNQLETGEVTVAMELVIPLCAFTPTGTVHPATLTTTYTPRARPTTFTPGG